MNIGAPMRRFDPAHLQLLPGPDRPVIGPDHPDLLGNRYGFEGGCVRGCAVGRGRVR